MKTAIEANVRWMLRQDLNEVVDIERESFDFAWDEDDFIQTLKQRNCIGMVVNDVDRIRGFMVYTLENNYLHILKFAVAPWARRKGFGTQMVDKLIGKLNQQRRQRIVLEVRETNLPAQLFFRAMKFEAREVIRSHYEDTAEDAFQFVYEI